VAIRVAVAGLGFMGQTHVKAWQQVPHATLAAVLSAQKSVTQVQGNLPGHTAPLELSGIAIHTTLDDVLSDSSIDAVDFCTPTYLHANLAVAALEAGKHVFVEKPMALNAAECQRMIEAAEASGKLLMVGHVLRFWGEYLPLMEAVRTGSLGRLLSLDLRRQCAAPAWGGWLRDPLKSGGGVFDLLIHDVDLCIALFGVPDAYSANGDADYLSASLRYEDARSVTIQGGWHTSAAFPFSMGYSARFEEGSMEFTSGGAAQLYRSNGEVEQLAGNAVDAFEAELSYFAECIQSGRSAQRCRMEDSAMAVALARTLIAATAERGRLIEC